jgi:hypothetical protein
LSAPVITLTGVGCTRWANDADANEIAARPQKAIDRDRLSSRLEFTSFSLEL